MIYFFFWESIFTAHGSAVEPAINLQVSSKSQESHLNYQFEIIFGEAQVIPTLNLGSSLFYCPCPFQCSLICFHYVECFNNFLIRYFFKITISEFTNDFKRRKKLIYFTKCWKWIGNTSNLGLIILVFLGSHHVWKILSFSWFSAIMAHRSLQLIQK